MRTNKPVMLSLLPIPACIALLSVLCTTPASAAPALSSETTKANELSPSTSGSVQPDNSKTNKGDDSSHALTADQAGEQPTDRDIMQKIRKAVVDDKSLSSYAHNIKIISQGGKVTLKGPVKSDVEKLNIETKAIGVAGTGNVVNELSVTNCH
jgi:hyperosmotically inducible protein